MATTLEIDPKRFDARSELRDGARQRGFRAKRNDILAQIINITTKRSVDGEANDPFSDLPTDI